MMSIDTVDASRKRRQQNETLVVGSGAGAVASAETLHSAGATSAMAGLELAPGTVISGSFSIVRPLGSGAMGIVFLAHDERLDRPVAIKFVRPDLGLEFRARFISEAKAMARVNHPNVVRIHAFGEHHRVPDVPVAVRILEEICRGVSAIHAADTAHRDIKPTNLLLDVDLRVRIADLGLAVLSRDFNAAQVVGTPGYMAPEVFRSGSDPALLPRIDVYSIACIAYELMTGSDPFQSKTNMELMLLHATKPVIPPSTLRPGLSLAFDSAILGALAKDAHERTPSAEAFRCALMAASDGMREPDRILLADDDADFREVLELVLKRAFPLAEIECVPDGRAALAAFDRKTPSIAILDLSMPHLEGIELTGLFRARASSASMPIIVLTASGGPDEWKRLLALGADGFLLKPVSLPDVVATVRRALQERSTRVD
jgi:serine/threonine-protein kinase